ncbi:MAG: hypothetical protein U0326_24855 [Polyangiales bacterium]
MKWPAFCDLASRMGTRSSNVLPLALLATLLACSGSDGVRFYDLSCSGAYQTRAGAYGLGGTCTFTRSAGATGAMSVCARMAIQSAAGITLLTQDVRGTLADGVQSIAIDYWIPQDAPATGASPRAWASGYCG